MRMLLLSASVFTTLVTAAGAAEPVRTWAATGLKNPESAVYDSTARAIYVSNVNGDPMAKDGNGFITKIAPDGRVLALEWVRGLDSPTGLALANGKLYAADVDRIVEIDPASGEITRRFEAPGAKFLNDLAVDAAGRVYASDMVTNSIWRLENGSLAVLLHDDALDNPNGLLVDGNRLVVACWGKMAPDFSTKVPGHVKAVSLASKAVSDLGDPAPLGNLDGLVSDGRNGYWATDWVSGGLFHIAPDGKGTRVLPLNSGSADLGMGPDGTVLIPMMKDGTVLSYRVE